MDKKFMNKMDDMELNMVAGGQKKDEKDIEQPKVPALNTTPIMTIPIDKTKKSLDEWDRKYGAKRDKKEKADPKEEEVNKRIQEALNKQVKIGIF